MPTAGEEPARAPPGRPQDAGEAGVGPGRPQEPLGRGSPAEWKGLRGFWSRGPAGHRAAVRTSARPRVAAAAPVFSGFFRERFLSDGNVNALPVLGCGLGATESFIPVGAPGLQCWGPVTCRK